jgi:hypothetical protein
LCERRSGFYELLLNQLFRGFVAGGTKLLPIV